MNLKSIRAYWDSPKNGFLIACFIFILFNLFLLGLRFAITTSLAYWYLAWNLFLAGVPIVFAYVFYKKNPKRVALTWVNSLLFVAWLLFLPNAFYIISDYVHLLESSVDMLMYDIVLFGSFTVSGFLLGYLSLMMIHARLIKSSVKLGYLTAFGALWLCGYAIYLGRFLRWNSWDVVTNPFGIIFDVSNSLINVSQYHNSFGITFLYFVFLSAIYLVLWKGLLFARSIFRRP